MYTEARPQYKVSIMFLMFLIDKPEDWKGTDPSRKMTTINWVSSLLVSVLTGNDLTNESRHPCLMTSSPIHGQDWGKRTGWVRAPDQRSEKRKKKKKKLGSCLLSNSRQPL
jgi:hypothetical protein